MSQLDSKVRRLLQSAARVPDESPSVVPFGFDTRIVALWRAGLPSVNGNGVGLLVRRVAILALAIIALSGAATIREYRQTEETVEPFSNEFAIADSAIQNEFLLQ